MEVLVWVGLQPGGLSSGTFKHGVNQQGAWDDNAISQRPLRTDTVLASDGGVDFGTSHLCDSTVAGTAVQRDSVLSC